MKTRTMLPPWHSGEFVTLRMNGPFGVVLELDEIRMQQPRSIVTGKRLPKHDAHVSLVRANGEPIFMDDLVQEVMQTPALKKRLMKEAEGATAWTAVNSSTGEVTQHVWTYNGERFIVVEAED